MKFALALLLLAAGCTIYKSSDRDSFNQNALAGAPVSFARTVGASDCWIMQTQASSIELTSERLLIQERHLLCSFSPDLDSAESRARMVELLESTSPF